MHKSEIAGVRFGRLIAVHFVDSPRGDARWLFRCDCGVDKVLTAKRVKDGSTKSCGCLRHEHPGPPPRLSHGAAKRGEVSLLYMVWQSMKQRCHNPNDKSYARYGGAGVIVCPEWHDFSTFQAWALSGGYARGLEIDRVNPAGDYCPANCRWITGEENRQRARPWGSVSRNPKCKIRTQYPPRDQTGRFIGAGKRAGELIVSNCGKIP